MNSSAKGDKFSLDVTHAAEAKGLQADKVHLSGHNGRKLGGVPADVVIEGHRVECKRYANGISTKRIEAILTAGDGIHAVASRCDNGIALVTLGLEDWLDLLQKAALLKHILEVQHDRRMETVDGLIERVRTA